MLSRGTIILVVLVIESTCYGLDDLKCPPTRECNSFLAKDCSLQEDTRDCSLKVDNRDCSAGQDTRSCSRDVVVLGRKVGTVNDPICESAKAAQNALYASQKAACETAKSSQNALYASQKATCESAKASQNAMYAAQKAACEADKTSAKADCERLKAQETAECAAVQAFRNAIDALQGPANCDASDTVPKLRTQTQNSLSNLAEWSGFLTTPLKRLIAGWKKTGCDAVGVGVLYQDAGHSTDGFWTVDVQLASFEINGVSKPPGDRYLRLEIQPTPFGGSAHDLADSHPLKKGQWVRFGGPVLIDRDPPTWLEVHPIHDLELLSGPPQ